MAMRTPSALTIALCLATLSGCTTNTSIANITTPGNETLELAVGTINNSAGTLLDENGNALPATTLNIVTSFRNTLGNSAFENPGQFTIAGPAGAIAPPPNNPSGLDCDQLFAYGAFPGCFTDKVFNPVVGLPPAFTPANTNGVGYSLGFIPTGASPTTGNYTVSTSVPVNGGMRHFSASATLPASPLILPNATGVISFASDGLGGGTFTIGNPAIVRGGVSSGISEYLIVVVNDSLGTVATVETTGTSATITGTDTTQCASGGTGIPIPCGANHAYVIGADYPLVEAGPPNDHSVRPALTGNAGTADLTVSPRRLINE